MRGGNERQSGGEVLKAWQLCDPERFRRDEQAVEEQELVAARAVASRARLPERFKAMTAAEMTARIDALRLLMQ